MFWFGEKKESDFNWKSDSSWETLSQKKYALARTSLDDILNLLDAFSNESFEEALPRLVSETGFQKKKPVRLFHFFQAS